VQKDEKRLKKVLAHGSAKFQNYIPHRKTEFYASKLTVFNAKGVGKAVLEPVGFKSYAIS